MRNPQFVYRGIRKNKTIFLRTGPNQIAFKYHNTWIVEVVSPHVELVLNTGGWWTRLTRDRMNQISEEFGLNYRVYTDRGDWIVQYRGVHFWFGRNSIDLVAAYKEWHDRYVMPIKKKRKPKSKLPKGYVHPLDRWRL